MARLAEGDAEPLGVLYERYGRMVFALVGRYASASGRAELEDLVQEVFLTLFETAPRYVETGKARAWICGVAVRKARAGWRRRFWRQSILARFAPGGAGTAAARASSVEADVDARVTVERALEKLPAAQREVLLLHVVESLSGDEIAEVLGISPNTVWTRLHRARQAMRAELRAADPTAEGGER